ncbi:MAG: hypothetical protein LQ342_002433 [Letrouitia transgressa]|nr:MAG: hypothetical protein LQ342_002433 [Letrouitia transgressa]
MPQVTVDSHLETLPQVVSIKEDSGDDLYDLAKVTFDKTLQGHYRHSTTGYSKVGVLFLTWEEDDLQCKETEVDALRDLFERRFHYETDYFEIPKQRWQTALQKRIADLFFEYDSPDCLTIIYYGGHGYVGGETQSLKLSAKIEADGDGDPTLFFNDVLACMRLPACDQLVIVDCCFAANAFSRYQVGKRKCELVTSSGYNLVPSPRQEGSFTKTLHQTLSRLLDDNPKGFITSTLYREIYHDIPHKVKPWLFDLSRLDYGRIWLRPQLPAEPPKTGNDEGSTFLKLTLKLNREPNAVVMNQLAMGLQYLPNVDEIRFDSLHAPKRRLEDFITLVVRAQKLRPLIRKLYAKLQLRKLRKMAPSGSEFKKLFLNQKVSPTYDWSSVLSDKNSSLSSPSIQHRKKSVTWPPTQEDTPRKPKILSARLLSLDFNADAPGNVPLPRLLSWQSNATNRDPSCQTLETDVAQKTRTNLGFKYYNDEVLSLSSDTMWHVFMWVVLCWTIRNFLIYMKE